MDQRDHQLLINEIHALKHLDHPGIPRFIEIYDDGKFFYIVMELIKGQTLTKFYEKKLANMTV